MGALPHPLLIHADSQNCMMLWKTLASVVLHSVNSWRGPLSTPRGKSKHTKHRTVLSDASHALARRLLAEASDGVMAVSLCPGDIAGHMHICTIRRRQHASGKKKKT